MAISLRIEDAGSNEVAEASLRASLVPISSVGAPAVLFGCLLWSQIDLPGAPAAAATLLAIGCVLGGMALRWVRHPPQRAHLAASATLAALFASVMVQLLVYPNPALGALHVVLAFGAAVSLIDLRWLIGVELFGAATWLVPFALVSPAPEWPLVGLVLLASSIAALAARIGHLGTVQRIHDLTAERESREDAIWQSNTDLRRAQRIASVGSYEWNPVTNELRWSDEHYRIFGWEPGEPLSSKRFIDAVVAEDQPRLVEALARSLNDGTPVDLEFQIRRPDGHRRLIHGLGETRLDASGRPISYSGTSRDITAGRRVAEALHASEGRLKAILTALELDKVATIDRDGTVVSILGKSGETGRYGVTTEEVSGRNIHDFVPGDGGDQILEAVTRTYQTGTGEELEASIDFPNGSFAFDVALRALRTSTGDVESVLAVVRDVTQRKTTERALQQAQKLESLGVLAGGIAHDFNNLLVGILGNSDTALLEIPMESPARRRILDVRQASECAADLTQQLLAYAGKAEVSFGPVDLGSLVSEMTELLRTSISGKARLEVERDTETVWVHADATQIRQVVMNFITNASEALEGESGRVHIRTGMIHADRSFLESCHMRVDLCEGDFALLEVSDDGSGMDSETSARIFDPFFTTKFQGRGLGLASTLGIVLRHRGAIKLESQPGVGTRIQVLLPLTAAPKPDASVHRSWEAPINATILVVDDEDMVRVAAARMLNALGYETIEVSSGPEAIDAAKAHGEAITAVLLDLTMPEMDGEQTLDALRALRSTIPVVFMSGHSDAELADRIRRTRFTTYIRKPFRLDALGHAIGSALARNETAE